MKLSEKPPTEKQMERIRRLEVLTDSKQKIVDSYLDATDYLAILRFRCKRMGLDWRKTID